MTTTVPATTIVIAPMRTCSDERQACTAAGDQPAGEHAAARGAGAPSAAAGRAGSGRSSAGGRGAARRDDRGAGRRRLPGTSPCLVDPRPGPVVLLTSPRSPAHGGPAL